MALKDDRPGLLSKVAMFVRNPTRDWAELDQAAEGDGAGYDKQALKAMIERKRQNDFVRKREFDQLRKLRSRDPVALAEMGRPSFFQTSIANEVEGRAVTLKKIDEIEAQMSRQWWKAQGREGEAEGAAGEQPPAKPDRDKLLQDDAQDYPGSSDVSLPFASTEPMAQLPPRVEDANEFAPTLMASEVMLQQAQSGQDKPNEPNVGFTASALMAIEEQEVATNPELEEAAIRFANGDDAGAEGALLAALRGPGLHAPSALAWASALLDFYRAVNNRQGFENAANEFALYLNGNWPVWSYLADVAEPLAAAPLPSHASGPVWVAPPTLTAHALAGLRAAMASNAMPWHLDWGGLKDIEGPAMPLLHALFDSLCTEAVRLQFEGHEHLTRALRHLTPSGERQVDRLWWQARLNALRAMGLQDDFELAALDYCITFEVAPPAWSAAACTVEMIAASTLLESAGGYRGLAVAAGADASAPGLSLAGEILGDASQSLMRLEAGSAPADQMGINCSRLIRVDFAAAGSILNWVAARQSEGKQVQFQNLHRLVATFFTVIGINEYAKVTARPL